MTEINTQLEPATKRKPPAAGMGRIKGVPNKLTRDVKQMVLGALQDVGGQAYLAKQAGANPVAFMSLLSKVIPLEVKSSVILAVASREPLPQSVIEQQWEQQHSPLVQ